MSDRPLVSFIADAELRAVEAGQFMATLAPSWTSMVGIHGGYVASITAQAILMTVDENRSLRSLDVQFVRPPAAGKITILSCLAAMQGAILLIAARREDQISSEFARHDYETNVEADRIVKETHALNCEIHAHTVQTNAGRMLDSASPSGDGD